MNVRISFRLGFKICHHVFIIGPIVMEWISNSDVRHVPHDSSQNGNLSIMKTACMGERPTHVMSTGKGLLGDTVLLITSFLMLGTKHTRVCVGRCVLMRLG